MQLGTKIFAGFEKPCQTNSKHNICGEEWLVGHEKQMLGSTAVEVETLNAHQF